MDNKKIGRSLLYIVLSIIVFSSCTKMPKHVSYIPSDASIVGVVDIAGIAKKAKLQDAQSFHMYKSLYGMLQTSDEEAAGLFEKVMNNPKQSGLDLLSDLFFYTVTQDNKTFACVSMKMNDKDKFQGAMEEVLSDQYDLIEKDEYTYYTNEKNSWIVFNKKAVVLISTLDAKQEDAEALIQRIFSKEKVESITIHKDFESFYKNKKDVSVWISSTQLLAGMSKSMLGTIESELENYDGLSITDIENNYVHIFLHFDSDNISLKAQLQPNEAFKNYLDSKDVSKDKLSEEIFAFFPSHSYIFSTFSFNSQKLFDNLKGSDDFVRMMKKTEKLGIDMQEVVSAIGGDVMLSFYDFSLDMVERKKPNFSVNEKGELVLGESQTVVEEQIVPKFTVAVSLNNDEIVEKVLSKAFPKNTIEKTDSYYDLSSSFPIPLYLAVQNNVAVFSSDVHAVQQVAEGGYGDNFTTSELSQEIEGSAFYYISLDYEQYPLQIKEFVQKSGMQYLIEPYTSLFESFVLYSDGNYSAMMKLNFKSDKDNSLYQLLQVIDASFGAK